MDDSQKRQALLDDPDFKALAQQKNSISMTLTAIIIVLYFGFILLFAFANSAISSPIANGTIGIPLGIGLIIIAWVLTGIYVRWANNKYDLLVEKVKQKSGEPSSQP